MILDPVDCARRSDRGFTLIEAVIAVGLLAVVIGLVTTSLRVLSATWDRGAEHADAQDMIARAVDVLSRDISGIRRVVQDGDNRPSFVFDGNAEQMRFVSIEPAYPSTPGPYVIELDARRSSDGKALVRSRSETAGPVVDLARVKLTDGVPLIEGNYAISFAYLGGDGERSGWSAIWTSNDRLPLMVEVKIEDRGRKRLVVPPLRIRTMIDAEHVCTRTKEKAPEQGREGEGEGNETGNRATAESRANPVDEASGQRADAASRTSNRTKPDGEDEAKDANPQLCTANADGSLAAAKQASEANEKSAKPSDAKGKQGPDGERGGSGDRDGER